MKLLFTRRHHLGSWLIRLVTWSEYSHVDIVMDSEFLLGAVAPSGVVYERLSHRLQLATKAVIMNVPVKDISAAYTLAYAQLRKPYDWFGVIGIGLHRNWQQDNRWSCAELVATVLNAGGLSLFDAKFYHRITPQDLLKLNFEKIKIK